LSNSYLVKQLNMTTSLDQLKQTGTVVVSDSGDSETIDVSHHHPLVKQLPCQTAKHDNLP